MITYRLATLADIPSIAKVHLMCFPDSMWAFLGEALIRAFYSEYVQEQNIFVVAEEDHSLIGFCMGYERPTKARERFMQKNKKALIRRVLIGLLSCNKLVYSKCLDNFLPKSKGYEATQKGDLLSICVLPEFRGKGVADALVQHFEELLRNRNITAYTLSVYTDNIRAISFYKRQGLEPVFEGKNEITMAKQMK